MTVEDIDSDGTKPAAAVDDMEEFFTRAKAWRADTVAGVTDKDKQVGTYSVEPKLENMCPLFHRMNALIGSKANVTPLAIFGSSLLTHGSRSF